MSIKTLIVLASLLAITACAPESQTETSVETETAKTETAKPAPKITMGNGEKNAIQISGLKRIAGVTPFAVQRNDNGLAQSFRGDSTALVFPEIVIEKAGFLVLHPIVDGKPNGDMVSAFTYLEAGQHKDVTIRIDHPADTGEKFMVMLHTDVNQDQVLDFVFVEDGVNVEDMAVFEGNKIIAQIFAIP